MYKKHWQAQYFLFSPILYESQCIKQSCIFGCRLRMWDHATEKEIVLVHGLTVFCKYSGKQIVISYIFLMLPSLSPDGGCFVM